MAKLSPNAPCPCHSGAKYKRCCAPFHQGDAPPTPEALMRSRFSAYALEKVDYILESTHRDGPHHGRYGQRQEVAAFCKTTSFDDLEIRDSSERGDRGEVAFYAHLNRDGNDVSFGERSLFFRVDGRWLYHSGTPLS